MCPFSGKIYDVSDAKPSIGEQIIDWVDENVAIGSWRDARDVDHLRSQGIDLIVDSRILFDDSQGRDLRIPRVEHMLKVVGLMQIAAEAGARILVRCYHGRDRSPFVAMVYLNRRYGTPYRQAYVRVKQKRDRTVFHWEWVDILEIEGKG
ncbi:MAG: Dual specificity phosphatase, catalytic domain [Methanomassiliicoccales archaeon PtaU1.Bin124]|nr:MAG: Dual specificity phosphatase, catalytic domain [Methanomassiliicoccales archaeon PtaU1.Bin124]